MYAPLLAAALVVAAPPPKAAAPKAPARATYTAQDQATLKRLSGLKVSPDGSKAVFVLRSTDLEANRGRTDLWLINADGSNLTQLTSHEGNEVEPTWSPDSKSLYFLAARSGTSQVWRLSLGGGEAVQVTQSPLDLEAFTLSPDGQTLVFAAEVFIDCDTLECTALRLKEKEKQRSTAQVYDSLFFRHWDTWKDGRRAHLFAQKVAGGPVVNLQKKQNADSPSKPFGGSSDFVVSPDSRSVVYVARDVGAQEAWSTDLDLWQVPLDGSRAPVKLTTSNRATDSNPVFSPDGKSLAYLAMSRPKFEADKNRIVIRDLASGSERSLDAWDRSPSSLTWSPDGRQLFLTADDLGQHALYRLDLAQGELLKVHGSGSVTEVGVTPQFLLVVHDSLKSASDLYSLAFDGKGGLNRLTDVNAEAFARFRLGDAEQFNFPGWNGETVYGYLVKPPGFDARKK